MGDFTGEHGGVVGHELVLLKTGGLIELYQLIVTAQSSENDDDEDEAPSSKTVSLRLTSRLETRSILRSGVVIRLTGSKRDVLAVTSDSGALSVLQFEPKDIKDSGNISSANTATSVEVKQLHCPVYGNTGCRRGTPGQHVAADPKGRAIMVAAIEKRKLVYVMNRDASNRSILASPLEVHRPRTITIDLVGLDTGYDNPMFAALEIQNIDPGVLEEDEEDTDEDDDEEKGGDDSHARGLKKFLVYYELDLGLNHVSRKWVKEVHPRSACLAALPGGGDGPGGVLVGSEDYVEYCHSPVLDKDSNANKSSSPPTRMICPLPRRKHHPSSQGILVQKIVVQRQKRNRFFALCQTDFGDVFKVALQLDELDQSRVTNVTIAVLDTLPVASSLNISKLGMLFCASEVGYPSKLYQFERIDVEDSENAVVMSHKQFIDSAAYKEKVSESSEERHLFNTSLAEACSLTFVPTHLKHLLPLTEIETLAPALGLLVGELVGTEVSPQLYVPCGRGSTSQLTIIRHGVAVNELAISDLPGTPGGIYAVGDPKDIEGQDKYIVISFADATLFLEIGPNGVEEVVDAETQGFITNAPTLACGALGSSGEGGGAGIVQVHPEGVRHIHQNQANEWRCAGLKKFEHGSVNEYQILVSYRFSGEIIYFELDSQGSGNLVEVATADVGNGSEILCVDVGPVPKGRTRSLFAAVGCRDGTVRILALLPSQSSRGGGVLSQKSMSSCHPSRPHSVCLQSTSPDGTDLSLTIGLDDGSTLRYDVDPVTGLILSSGAPSKRILGARPVKVIRSNVQGRKASLLLSSRPWISMSVGGGTKLGETGAMTAPLSYAPLDHAHALNSVIIGGEGIIATVGNTLRILSIDTASAIAAVTSSTMSKEGVFHLNKVDLRYTPRQQCLLGGKYLAFVESDVLEYSLEDKKAQGFDPGTAGKKVRKSKFADRDAHTDDMDMDMDDDEQKKEAEAKEEDIVGDEDEEGNALRTTPVRGPLPPVPTAWASCIRLVDPKTSSTMGAPVELDKNEAAFCCCNVQFASRSGEPLLAVGTVTSFNLQTQAFTAAHIHLYRMVGDRLQLLHKTKVEAPVLAVTAFQGRLLVGVGRTLRLYEMGKRQLLRKCEIRSIFPTMIKTLHCASDRVFGGDLLHGMYALKYAPQSNKFVLLAKDMLTARSVTAVELLDLHTLAVADKFGNVSVLRLPKGIGTSGGVDVSNSSRALWDTSSDARTPRVEMLCQYFVGEIVTGMTRATLVSGGAESLLYVTVTGRIGALCPAQSRGDIEFLELLERSMRNKTYEEVPRYTGRDPQSYRSYYAPVKHVVDGDLCESFEKLATEVQKAIAEDLDRSVIEVKKKLDDLRSALL
jgi:splicing factor 3B subunit 3